MKNWSLSRARRPLDCLPMPASPPPKWTWWAILPARAALMLDTAAADAVDAASSRAPGAFVEELVVIASTTSTGQLADTSVPTTKVDMAGLLPARAALMLDTAAADAVDAATSQDCLPTPASPPLKST